MPRVTRKAKNRAGKPYRCVSCPDPIVAGQDYYEWAFFRSRPQRQHASHGAPKQSQLTQSKLAAVYAAQESAHETINISDDPSDIAQALRDVAEVAREMQSEYEEAAEHFGGQGENQERAEALESYADELDGEADDIEGESFEAEEPEMITCPECGGIGVEDDSVQDPEECSGCSGSGEIEDPDYEPRNADGELEDEWIETLRDKARDALNNVEPQ